MDLLSIVLPLYNGEKYIEETISYILRSDYNDIELLVIDDGSTDESPEIVRKIAEADKRVVIYTKENGGVVSARNYGASKAQGKYLCFADQDDIVKPFMYSSIISRMEAFGSEIGMCSTGRLIDGAETGFDILDDMDCSGDEIREKVLFPMLFNGFNVDIPHSGGNHYPNIWSMVFERTFWLENKLEFRAYVNFEDDMLVKIEALSKVSRVSCISEIGYLWRVNMGSETYAGRFVENIGEKQDREYFDIENSCKAFNPDNSFFEQLKQAIYCRQYLFAIRNLNGSGRKLTRKEIKNYYDCNIYSRDFEEAIRGRKRVKKDRIKLRMILPALAKRHTMFSRNLEKALDRFLILTLRSPRLTAIERGMKKG